MLDSRNAATASKPNVAHDKLTTNNKHQHWDSILAAVSVLNMYVVHDLNSLDAYTLCMVHEQDYSVGEAQDNKLHSYYYCLHAIQHVM